MDPLDFASLAHIRILLLPVGNIKRTAFDTWAAEIRTFDSIRLGDIPADTLDERARFMPNPLAAGHIHLSYSLHPLPSSHIPLSLFRPSDFPLGVIGVASCSQSDSLSSILAHFNASLSELFPSGAIFPLTHNCFVFEESDGSTNLNLGNLPGLVVIPGMMGNKKLYVGTLLADLCSNILAEFATVVNSLESPLGNEYLNSTLFPTLPPPSEMPKPLETDNPTRSSLPPLPTQHSQPDIATSSSLLRAKTPTTLSVKRNSSIGPGVPPSPYRHNSLPAQAIKKRQAAIGAVSSHGRLFKVLGDLFLLAGRTMDASVWYSEAVVMLKATQDTVWHASALEGIATVSVVDAWSSSQTNGADNEKEPWSEIADKLSQAISLYQKTPPPVDVETNHSFVAWFYARAVLRHASLLFAIWSAKGWGPLAFTTMLQTGIASVPQTLTHGDPSRSNDGKRISCNFLERLTLLTGITRSAISNTLAQAHGPWLLHLGARERILILEHMAAMYGMLGFERKETYILREVLGCVMDLVVCGREEGGGAKIAGAGLGIHGVDLGAGSNQGTVGIRTNNSTEGNDSVLRVVKHICKAHGIDLDAVKLVDNDSWRSSASQTAAHDDELVSFEEPYGWPELQIGIVREAIAVAEALPDYLSVAQFSLSSLKTLYRVMSQGDQHNMYSTAARALATAKRRGDSRCVDYWSGQPMVSIEVLSLPLIRLPIEKPSSILSQLRQSVTPILTGMTDPFLYNPRKLASGQGETLLVQNEPFEIVVTLRNPFVFDLELSSLTLSTTGVAIESKPMALVIPANSYHPVTITAQVLEAGILMVRGCIVQAPGGAPREFVLPVSSEDEESKRSRGRSAIENEAGRSKHAGLDSRLWKKQEKRYSKANTPAQPTPMRFLECKVVPEQPFLRIRRTSLTHGALMLYNGEKSSIRITLENTSSLPIDFMRLTFDDSTIAPAQQALADGGLSVFDTYETEYDLIHKPVFTWDSKGSKQEIGPGEKTVVTVNCVGKVGCASGVVHVSYSYFHRPRTTLDQPSDIFHTRQLSYPVLVTVYHMLECHAMDILPYSPDSTFATTRDSQGDGSDTTTTKIGLIVDDITDWCIFSIEVRNTYGLPFEVTFERQQADTEPCLMTSVVPPGSMSRVLIPVQKFRLAEEHISRPIPTLSDRQFILTKSNLTSAEERTQQELFWYREELLKLVRGRWKESGGTRTGDLSLRNQRMTQRMVEILRTEIARIQLSLWHYKDDGSEPSLVPCSGDIYTPPLNDFVYLRAKVMNLSPSQLTLTINLLAEPAQHIIYEGILSDIPIGRLQSGESYDLEIPLTFVSCGRFELSAEVFTSGSQERSRIGRGQLRARVQE